MHLRFTGIFFYLTASAQVVVAPNEDNLANEGETVLISCTTFGSPQPETVWRRNGSVLTNDSFDGRATIYEELVEVDGSTFVVSTLEICSIGEMDAGVFSCQAVNSLISSEEIFFQSFSE